MRIQVFLLIGFLLLTSCNRNSKLPEFSFGDYTFLKFTIKNCQTSGNLTLSYVSVCPLEQTDINISYKVNTTNLLKLAVNHPVTINLLSPNINATCFALPKDTLEIFIDLSPAKKGKERIVFKGKNSTISDYLTYSKHNISSSPKNYENINGYTKRIDFLKTNALIALYKFDRTTPLPDWFIKMEKLDINYSVARDKVFQFKHRQRFNYKYRLVPKGYLNELDIKLNNPKAKYSLSYYGFLNNYSTMHLYNYIGQQNLSPDDTYKYILENIRMANKNLHSEVKELYIAQRICALLSKSTLKQALGSNDSLYFQRVDSLISIARETFKNDKVLNTLLNYQSKQFQIALD